MKKDRSKQSRAQENRLAEDGDTRPDLQPSGQVDGEINRNARNVTKERGADTNSLEDYKDKTSSHPRTEEEGDARATSPVPGK